MLKITTTIDRSLKITNLKLQPHLPGANEIINERILPFPLMSNPICTQIFFSDNHRQMDLHID